MPSSSFTGCVLQVVPELDTGGVEQTVVDVAEAVLAAGGRSLVATRGGRLQERLEKGGTQVFNLPVHSKNLWVQWRIYRTLRRLIRRENVSLVHVRSRAPALSAIAAARAEKIASVATYHGIYNANSSLKRWYNSQMTRADITIANSDYTRAHILKTYPNLPPERVVSIPRGVDLHRFDPEAFVLRNILKLEEAWGLPPADAATPDTRTRFLLAARLTRWKGQGLIIEAAARLRTLGRDDFIIFIAGDDQGRSDYTAELRAAIAAHGLEAHVRLVGHCADMPSAWQVCHFALAPSLEPEAFGRTAVEPQAMQRPPLAAAHGATVETVVPGETGWLVRPGDAQAWAEAMREAMSLTPEQRFEMGLAGRARVKALFSLETMCARTLDVYRSLLM
ncbi:glycosyltransferase family 4 protein [Asticcacaulis sp. EMRT-3]|uniref:glycosyltransferase family 4 protein n=1 Tax=Asticcacaulis sp. EMRT-3 TaxID=3040349 RepID=UPI0024AEC74A|nr:glycosyltransferase family 4 protein [Asticcacaulis sp. EMRT-3]MDI7773847.1 glycosyltransferase family 4 protein [Asticcacaulis sp. EMRT-3]